LGNIFSESQAKINYYEKCIHSPKMDLVKRIADYFDVSVDYLVGRTEIRKMAVPVRAFELDETEEALINAVRGLSKTQRLHVLMIVNSIANKNE